MVRCTCIRMQGQDDCKVGSFSILSESCFTGLKNDQGRGPSTKSQYQTNPSSDKDFAIVLAARHGSFMDMAIALGYPHDPRRLTSLVTPLHQITECLPLPAVAPPEGVAVRSSGNRPERSGWTKRCRNNSSWSNEANPGYGGR